MENELPVFINNKNDLSKAQHINILHAGNHSGNRQTINKNMVKSESQFRAGKTSSCNIG